MGISAEYMVIKDPPPPNPHTQWQWSMIAIPYILSKDKIR